MNGHAAVVSASASLASAAPTNPTGKPMISAGSGGALVEHLEQAEERRRRVADRHHRPGEMRAPQIHRRRRAGGADLPGEIGHQRIAERAAGRRCPPAAAARVIPAATIRGVAQDRGTRRQGPAPGLAGIRRKHQVGDHVDHAARMGDSDRQLFEVGGDAAQIGLGADRWRRSGGRFPRRRAGSRSSALSAGSGALARTPISRKNSAACGTPDATGERTIRTGCCGRSPRQGAGIVPAPRRARVVGDAGAGAGFGAAAEMDRARSSAVGPSAAARDSASALVSDNARAQPVDPEQATIAAKRVARDRQVKPDGFQSARTARLRHRSRRMG